MAKTLVHPETGRVFKMGRRMPAAHHPRLMLARYLEVAKLPAVPDHFDFSLPAKACLSQILCNDVLSCCTASGALHLLGLFLASAGHPVTWADWQVHLFYKLTTGWNGTPATDNGGDEIAVLNFWRDHGIDGKGAHRIKGHVAIAADNPAELRAACFLLLNLYFGMSMPGDWIKRPPSTSGFVWNVAGDPDPENGHCFVSPAGVTNEGVIIDSWGLRGLITWAAIAKYGVADGGGEVHAVVSSESISSATHKAQNALAFDAMAADFKLLGGALPA